MKITVGSSETTSTEILQSTDNLSSTETTVTYGTSLATENSESSSIPVSTEDTITRAPTEPTAEDQTSTEDASTPDTASTEETPNDGDGMSAETFEGVDSTPSSKITTLDSVTSAEDSTSARVISIEDSSTSTESQSSTTLSVTEETTVAEAATNSVIPSTEAAARTETTNADAETTSTDSETSTNNPSTDASASEETASTEAETSIETASTDTETSVKETSTDAASTAEDSKSTATAPSTEVATVTDEPTTNDETMNAGASTSTVASTPVEEANSGTTTTTEDTTTLQASDTSTTEVTVTNEETKTMVATTVIVVTKDSDATTIDVTTTVTTVDLQVTTETTKEETVESESSSPSFTVDDLTSGVTTAASGSDITISLETLSASEINTSEKDISRSIATESDSTLTDSTAIASTVTSGSSASLPLTTLRPPVLGPSSVNISFELKFNTTWTENNTHDEMLKGEVFRLVSESFSEFSWYFNCTVTELRPSAAVSTESSFVLMPLLEAAMSDPVTIADYTVSVDILESMTKIQEDILGTVIPKLTADSVNGAEIDVDYTTDAMNYSLTKFVDEFKSSGCSNVIRCSEACRNCTVNKIEARISCDTPYECSNNKVCESDPDTDKANEDLCKCKNEYLPVGSGCTSKNVIIGVTVGVGAALLLGIIIAVVIFRRNRDSSENEPGDWLSDDVKGVSGYQRPRYNTRGERNNAYEMNEGPDMHAPRGQGQDDFRKGDNSRGQGQADFRRGGNGAGPASDNYYTRLQPSAQRGAYDDPVLSGAAVASWENDKVNKEEFKDFTPQLQNVDTTKAYALKRPSVDTKASPNRYSVTSTGETYYF